MKTILITGTTSGIGKVTAQELAGQRVQIMLRELWSARDTASFALPPSKLHLEPGDTVHLVSGAHRHRLRLLELQGAGRRDVQARAHDLSVYQPPISPDRTAASGGEAGVLFGEPRLVAMDLPLAGTGDEGIGPRLAAWAQPWPGGISVYRDFGENETRLQTSLELPATIGVTQNELSAAPAHRFDKFSRLRVSLPDQTLQSVSQTAMLNGANIAALGVPGAAWELIQFANAELVSEGLYELSLLLRGQAGSELDIPALWPAGTIFVLLDEAVEFLPVDLSMLGATLSLKAGPQQLDLANPAYVDLSLPVPGHALRPLAPVHLRARREGTDVWFSWVRQTRIGGDGWETADVPLAEEDERYLLKVFKAGAPVRSLELTHPTHLYSAVDQETDFGLPLPSSFEISVAQVSRSFGPGAAREAQVHV